jgi:hypothetical protein
MRVLEINGPQRKNPTLRASMLTDRCIRGVGGSSHWSATNPRNIFSNHYREVHGKVDHRKSDRWLSYRFYSTSQRQKLPLRYVCEIFGARRFSSFSTQSAMSGRPFHNRSFRELSLRAKLGASFRLAERDHSTPETSAYHCHRSPLSSACSPRLLLFDLSVHTSCTRRLL